MPSPELVLGGTLVSALVLYFLLGGADFGGGVWDLLARGPRKEAQRALIERVIGPIWEANHVWLIIAAVLLFSGFPRAFSALTTALHVPLTLFLLAIVFRGSAFVFRSYDSGVKRRRRWGGLFSVASAVGPFMLGMVVGAVASGEVRVEGNVVTGGFFAPWLRPFPFAVGGFALVLAAFLAATYLSYEADTRELQDDFRRRALVAGVGVGVLAVVCLLLSFRGAPVIAHGLTARPWTWPLHVATGVSAVLAFAFLWTRRFRLARYAAGAQTGLILVGWALSQYPYVLPPSLTLEAAASHPATLRALMFALAAGVPILGPSLFLLFRVFKSGAPRAS